MAAMLDPERVLLYDEHENNYDLSDVALASSADHMHISGGPSTVRFPVLRKHLETAGFRCQRVTGSHFIFERKATATSPRVCFPVAAHGLGKVVESTYFAVLKRLGREGRVVAEDPRTPQSAGDGRCGIGRGIPLQKIETGGAVVERVRAWTPAPDVPLCTEEIGASELEEQKQTKRTIKENAVLENVYEALGRISVELAAAESADDLTSALEQIGNVLHRRGGVDAPEFELCGGGARGGGGAAPPGDSSSEGRSSGAGSSPSHGGGGGGGKSTDTSMLPLTDATADLVEALVFLRVFALQARALGGDSSSTFFPGGVDHAPSKSQKTDPSTPADDYASAASESHDYASGRKQNRRSLSRDAEGVKTPPPTVLPPPRTFDSNSRNDLAAAFEEVAAFWAAAGRLADPRKRASAEELRKKLSAIVLNEAVAVVFEAYWKPSDGLEGLREEGIDAQLAPDPLTGLKKQHWSLRQDGTKQYADTREHAIEFLFELSLNQKLVKDLSVKKIARAYAEVGAVVGVLL